MKDFEIHHSKPWLLPSDREAVGRVILSNSISEGSLRSEFCRQVAAYLNADSVEIFPSGTVALAFAVRLVIDKEKNDIILPTYTCAEVWRAVKFFGGNPILCDVGEQWIGTVESVEEKVGANTAGALAIHTFGYRCDLGELSLRGCPVIEDSAHRFVKIAEAKPNNISVHSFHATKCFTTGEGGAIVAGTRYGSALKELVRGSRELGDDSLFSFADLAAGLGLSQLSRYEEFLRRRSAIEQRYRSAFRLKNSLIPPPSDFLFRFPIWSEKPYDEVHAEFRKKGVHVRRGVDTLLHRLLGEDDSSYPNAVNCYDHTVSIPFYPGLTDEEVDHVIQSANEIL